MTGEGRKRKKRIYLEFKSKFVQAKQVLQSSSLPNSSKRKPIRSVDEGARGGQRWIFCIRPRTSDSPIESRLSDPIDPTHEKKVGSRTHFSYGVKPLSRLYYFCVLSE
ncbi:hypothetical protein SAY87_012451 [Trapa incisa]|uniref:Uncharacterized protein n=1 Tax=Trapa incisa TaxID=236973 RepID=A0AAN7JIW7_9MYRT|nr:hypothetical protein SAY87_012451 [Trapa incisa]